jgi:hypothetical protein
MRIIVGPAFLFKIDQSSKKRQGVYFRSFVAVISRRGAGYSAGSLITLAPLGTITMRPVQRPNPDTKRPKLIAPRGACDTHLHLYGRSEAYPLSAERNYTPDPRSSIDDYLSVHRALGLERAVIVTGSANVQTIK